MRSPPACLILHCRTVIATGHGLNLKRNECRFTHYLDSFTLHRASSTKLRSSAERARPSSTLVHSAPCLLELLLQRYVNRLHWVHHSQGALALPSIQCTRTPRHEDGTCFHIDCCTTMNEHILCIHACIEYMDAGTNEATYILINAM